MNDLGTPSAFFLNEILPTRPSDRVRPNSAGKTESFNLLEKGS